MIFFFAPKPQERFCLWMVIQYVDSLLCVDKFSHYSSKIPEYLNLQTHYHSLQSQDMSSNIPWAKPQTPIHRWRKSQKALSPKILVSPRNPYFSFTDILQSLTDLAIFIIPYNGNENSQDSKTLKSACSDETPNKVMGKGDRIEKEYLRNNKCWNCPKGAFSKGLDHSNPRSFFSSKKLLKKWRSLDEKWNISKEK